MWIAIFFVVLGLLLLWALAIMPRVSGKPDFSPLKNRFYAHRGYYEKDQSIPENSLPGFALAMKNQFGVELDVHLTKDGKLAVLHDENLKRMCGVDITLSQINSTELQNYHLAGTEYTIPLFEDVLKLIHGEIPMIIEVKPYGGNIAALCERLCTELEGYTGEYCMESFDPRAVNWFRKHRPTLVRGQLSMGMRRYDGETSRLVAFLMSNLLTNFLTKPDFIAYCVEDRKNLSFRLCKKLYGVQEFAWTVHTPHDAHEVQKTGGMLIFEHFDPRK